MSDLNTSLIDFAIKMKYPFQYPNMSNPGLETQLATVEDWIKLFEFGYGPDAALEFIWEYIDHEQSKNI